MSIDLLAMAPAAIYVAASIVVVFRWKRRAPRRDPPHAMPEHWPDADRNMQISDTNGKTDGAFRRLSASVSPRARNVPKAKERRRRAIILLKSALGSTLLTLAVLLVYAVLELM